MVDSAPDFSSKNEKMKNAFQVELEDARCNTGNNLYVIKIRNPNRFLKPFTQNPVSTATQLPLSIWNLQRQPRRAVLPSEVQRVAAHASSNSPSVQGESHLAATNHVMKAHVSSIAVFDK